MNPHAIKSYGREILAELSAKDFDKKYGGAFDLFWWGFRILLVAMVWSAFILQVVSESRVY